MSELLEAAAQVVGAPTELVQRSAEARASASGVSVEEILRAWAGQGPEPAPEAPPAAAPAPSPARAELEPAVARPAPVPAATPAPSAPPAAAPAAVAATGSSAPQRPVVVYAPTVEGPPPILTGRVDRPLRYFFGAAALLILCLAITLVVPTISGTGRGVLHSEIPYSEMALQGQGEYLAEGCAACHTQLVRPIIADAQLAALAGQGGVTLSDSNQVIGRQRYGPDLANVGNRMTPDDIQTVLSGEDGHLSYGGSSMDSLVAYLVESRVLTDGGSDE